MDMWTFKRNAVEHGRQDIVLGRKTSRGNGGGRRRKVWGIGGVGRGGGAGGIRQSRVSGLCHRAGAARGLPLVSIDFAGPEWVSRGRREALQLRLHPATKLRSKQREGRAGQVFQAINSEGGG